MNKKQNLVKIVLGVLFFVTFPTPVIETVLYIRGRGSSLVAPCGCVIFLPKNMDLGLSGNLPS